MIFDLSDGERRNEGGIWLEIQISRLYVLFTSFIYEDLELDVLEQLGRTLENSPFMLLVT